MPPLAASPIPGPIYCVAACHNAPPLLAPGHCGMCDRRAADPATRACIAANCGLPRHLAAASERTAA